MSEFQVFNIHSTDDGSAMYLARRNEVFYYYYVLLEMGS